MLEKFRKHYAATSGVTWAVAIALLVLQLLPALLRPAEFVQDDSYFYLQIAGNIAAGNGSTFHGVTPTNGYHPLWMVCVVGAAAIAGGDKTLALQLVVLVQALLVVVALALFKRLTGALALEHWLPGLVVLASYLLGTGLYGSEAHLNACLLLAATLSLWRTLSSPHDRGWFLSGVLFGAAILARLDNVFVAATLPCFALLHDRPAKWSQRVRRGVHTGLGLAVSLGPYLAYNLLTYGHFMPISGAVKGQSPFASFDLERLGPMGMLAVPLGLVCLLVGLALDRDRRRRVVWLGIGAGVLLHALYVVAWTDHYTFWAWYYVLAVIAASLAASYMTGWLLARMQPMMRAATAARLVAACALLLLAGFTARAWLKGFGPVEIGPLARIRVNEYRWPEEFAQWMKAHLPRGSIVFAQDWPGAIAYYSDMRILPMDGLVNDFRYNDELLSVGVETYLCSQGVGYFLGHLRDPRETHEVPVTAPLYRKPAGILTFEPQQLVVETRTVLKRPEEAPPFALWRIRCSDP